MHCRDPGRAIQSAQVTIASLIAAADEIRGLAVPDKQYSATVGAVKEMGKPARNFACSNARCSAPNTPQSSLRITVSEHPPRRADG